MTLALAADTAPSLMMIEAGLTAIAVAVSFALPGLGASWLARTERAFARLARRKGLSVILVGASAFVLRLAILPFCPIPLPFIQDDFSFLLSGNTFALGRLANPTPVMWTHFETVQETMHPTYMSMYFPAQGLALAAGKALFGHPWFGILCVTALMCAAFCWMLQAWLPPAWALLGGVLVVLRIGLFSYWINTYTGGGCIAALGGALVMGALPRLTRTARTRYGVLLATGIALLALCRPYEGLLLSIPVGLVLGRWMLFGKNRPPAVVLLRRAVFPLALIAAALAWLGYYDYRAFGSPLTLPYSVDRAQYAVVPYWFWQPPRAEPVYRHKLIRDFYTDVELGYAKRLRSVPGFLKETLLFKPLRTFLFFAGFALLPPLIMLPRVFRDRRIRFLVVCLLVVLCGVLLQTWLIPHYLAAVTPAIYAVGLQAMRHLRQCKPGGQPVGMAMLRYTMVVCIALAALRLWAEPLHLTLAPWPSPAWSATWHGPGRLGLERARIEHQLQQLPGGQLVLVRYAADHSPMDEWVYNSPVIDGEKVIWARDMDAANNLEIANYYKDRQVWLVQPDATPASVTPYPKSK
jgi:hypothetical protein